jgi:WD40 repeat protein
MKFSTIDIDGGLNVWNFTPARKLMSIRSSTGDQGFECGIAYCFSESGTLLATKAVDGRVEVWDSETGQRTAILSDNPSKLQPVGFVNDDSQLVCLVYPQHLPLGAQVWDLATKKLKSEFTLTHFMPGERLSYTKVQPYEQVLALGTDRGILLYSLSSESFEGLIPTLGWKTGLEFSRFGSILLSGSSYGTATVWNWRTRTASHQFTGHAGPVRGVALSPDGKTAATGDGGGTIRLWDLQSGQEMLQIDTASRNQDVSFIGFAPDGRTLACICTDTHPGGTCEVRVWSIGP